MSAITSSNTNQPTMWSELKAGFLTKPTPRQIVITAIACAIIVAGAVAYFAMLASGVAAPIAALPLIIPAAALLLGLIPLAGFVIKVLYDARKLEQSLEAERPAQDSSRLRWQIYDKLPLTEAREFELLDKTSDAKERFEKRDELLKTFNDARNEVKTSKILLESDKNELLKTIYFYSSCLSIVNKKLIEKNETVQKYDLETKFHKPTFFETEFPQKTEMDLNPQELSIAEEGYFSAFNLEQFRQEHPLKV